MKSQHALRRSLGAVLSLCLLAPATATAAPVVAKLRVEGAGQTLERGTSYVTDTSRIETDRRPVCGGSGRIVTIQGPSALGILDYAAPVNRSLRPLGVTDKFEFGPFVCGLGRFVAGDLSSYWLFKVDHRLAQVGADKVPLRRGSEVLWYFVNTATGTNTGVELELVAPARARIGEPFDVAVFAYNADGNRTPAAGAQVRGATVQTTDARGLARVTLDRIGVVDLRAERAGDTRWWSCRWFP